jgi:molybdopterin-guanine dinucleotide biosynthesis protein A
MIFAQLKVDSSIIINSMLTLAIQAGGDSRRMGQDKALLPFLGQPLIIRVLERLKPLADEILITTNHPQAYRFLGLPLYPDQQPGRGALGGLYTALNAASHPLVAVVACDMPFVSPALLSALRDALLATQADIAIPVTGEGSEPFHAIYRRLTCLPPVQQALEAGNWRVDSWFSQVQLYPMQPDEIHRYDPDGLCFWNVNTPEELKAAQQLAERL